MANYSKLQKDDLVNLAIARGIPNSEAWDLTKAQLVDFLNTHRDESGEWVTDPDPDDEPEMTNKAFTQAEIDEYRSFIEDQVSGYFTDAQLIEMMAGDEPKVTSITATKGTETLTFQFEQEDKASVVIRYYIKKGYTVTVNDGDETHTLKPDFPKLTPAQERAWQLALDWHKKHGKVYAGFTPAGHSNFGINIAGVFGITETEATIKALVKKGLLVSVGKGIVPKAPWMECYAIHSDYIPAAPALEPAPAAAPAHVNNAPLKSRIDAGMGYTERYKSENWRSETPTNPGYDSLKTLADKQDEYIQALEARVKELETELAEESADLEATAIRETQLAKRITELEGDMERLAAREMELLQQNTLLNSVVDRLCQCATMVETAAQNAVEAYGKQDAEYTMRVLAHLVGIEWN